VTLKNFSEMLRKKKKAENYSFRETKKTKRRRKKEKKKIETYRKQKDIAKKN